MGTPETSILKMPAPRVLHVWLLCMVIWTAVADDGVDRKIKSKNTFKAVWATPAPVAPAQLSQSYTTKLFQKYGNGGVMTFEGFEHLLESLGLGNIAIPDHDIHDHQVDSGFKHLHMEHDHNKTKSTPPYNNHDNEHDHSHSHEHDPEETMKSGDHNIRHTIGDDSHSDETDHHGDKDHEGHVTSSRARSDDHSTKDEFDTPVKDNSNRRKRMGKKGRNHHHHASHKIIKRALQTDEKQEQCLSADQILASFRIRSAAGISEDAFLYLCPAIVNQLDNHVCSSRTPCPLFLHEKDLHCKKYHGDHHPAHGHHHGNDTTSAMYSGKNWPVSAKVWGFAVLSVTVISLVGLVCVAIIPLMKRLFFESILQFLISLAIGSLTGDALLHLLPHAVISPATDDHGHDDGLGHDQHGIWIGMVVLGGIYIFLVMERLLAIISQCRDERQRNKKEVSLDNKDFALREIGEKSSKHSYPPVGVQSEEIERLKSSDVDGYHDDVIAEEKAHGHGHGHSHEVPGSVSSIAWMVIMGDGLHNLTDGLAIGAAFANSMSTGLSTSIAVFCHELPHELGDFAVLLSAGMSVKQALFYNIVSSVLCFLGMIIGVFVGNITSASSYIFALTAGIFIYIALVDMLPELSAQKNRGRMSSHSQLLLQMLGITIGVTIMLLIALYEDRITVQ